jgi:hypothetical protein
MSRRSSACGELALPSNKIAQSPKLAAVDNEWPREAGTRIALSAINPHEADAAVPLPYLLAVQKKL